jgi:hypothetical protein
MTEYDMQVFASALREARRQEAEHQRLVRSVATGTRQGRTWSLVPLTDLVRRLAGSGRAPVLADADC